MSHRDYDVKAREAVDCLLHNTQYPAPSFAAVLYEGKRKTFRLVVQFL
jgi:hypothetical protein